MTPDQPAALTGAPSLAQVLAAVSEATGVPVADLRGRCRKRRIVRARQLAAWLGRTRCGRSYPKLGQWLGGLDHTSIINACRVMDALVHTDPFTARDREAAEHILGATNARP